MKVRYCLYVAVCALFLAGVLGVLPVQASQTVEFTTDKSTYLKGEPVLISVRNTGTEVVSFSTTGGSLPCGYWIRIDDSSGHTICPQITPLAFAYLQPGDTTNWYWNQQGELNGDFYSWGQVPAGKYYVHAAIDATHPRLEITILDSPYPKRLRFTTDKTLYALGESIVFTVLNIGTEAVYLSCWESDPCPDWFSVLAITNTGVIEVFPELHHYGVLTLNPGSSTSYTWDQKDAYGNYVPSGWYEAITWTELLGDPNKVFHISGGVGGIEISIDKLGLLAPYIGLTSIILFATVAAVIYTKRVWHKRERQ